MYIFCICVDKFFFFVRLYVTSLIQTFPFISRLQLLMPSPGTSHGPLVFDVSKTELMISTLHSFCSCPQPNLQTCCPLSDLNLSKWQLGSQAQNLGVLLDSTFFLIPHVQVLLSLPPEKLSNPSLQTDLPIAKTPGLKKRGKTCPSPTVS